MTITVTILFVSHSALKLWLASIISSPAVHYHDAQYADAADVVVLTVLELPPRGSMLTVLVVLLYTRHCACVVVYSTIISTASLLH